MTQVENYAVINASGLVVNVIVWDGIAQIDVGEGMLVVPANGAQIGWTYGNGVFMPPPAPAVIPPTPAEILATNTATRNQLLAAATLAIAPLQDAEDLGEATPTEAALLKSWKQVRVAVIRVDLTLANPTWPVVPQPGYGAAFAPQQPTAL